MGVTTGNGGYMVGIWWVVSGYPEAHQPGQPICSKGKPDAVKVVVMVLTIQEDRQSYSPSNQ